MDLLHFRTTTLQHTNSGTAVLTSDFGLVQIDTTIYSPRIVTTYSVQASI